MILSFITIICGNEILVVTDKCILLILNYFRRIL